MVTKSERLKKLENELGDLEQWLKLGLVPKRDIEKHKAEIESVRTKMHEEEERLKQLKESGEIEEYMAPKRGGSGRPAYQEPQTMPGIDGESEQSSDTNLDMETETYDAETTLSGTEEKTTEYTTSGEDEEDPFSDKNRWRRGILEDPDVDQW